MLVSGLAAGIKRWLTQAKRANNGGRPRWNRPPAPASAGSRKLRHFALPCGAAPGQDCGKRIGASIVGAAVIV